LVRGAVADSPFLGPKAAALVITKRRIPEKRLRIWNIVWP
jgi:hypothetical protein